MFNTPSSRSPFLLSMGGGILAVIAFAPFNFVLSLVISICLLLFQIDKVDSSKKAALVGYFWGLGFFIAGLHWFAFALTIDLKRFFWLIPFSLIVIQAVLALYVALFAYLAKIQFKNNILRIYFLACCWTTLEWLRGALFSGFPWIISGYCFAKQDSISQLASITGIYGLSFTIIVISISIYSLIKHTDKSNCINCCFVLLITSGITFWGQYRIKSQDLAETKMPSILLVQPGTLAHKPSQEDGIKTFFQHLDLSKQNYRGEDIIIWSESAHPFLIDKEKNHFADLFNFIKADSKVIFGSPSITFDENQEKKYWNSMIVANQQGKIETYYNKMHLVPFGEYIPLQSFLPPLNIITENLGSYSASDKMRNIKLNEHVIRPLICYEAIFSDHPEDLDTKADFIINITNDNWYGDSIGPYQHLSMTKYRAIEHGKPLVRVAISGISAIFDSYGRTIEQIGLSQKGVVSATLPRPLRVKTSYSAKIEYFFILSLTIFSLIIFALNNRKQAVDKNVEKH
jgi:apolipoprotein N-acyltransferase